MIDPYSDIKKKLKQDKSLIYLDIETTPMKAYCWRLGEQVITHEQVIEESRVIMVQWMFEGDSKVSYLTWDRKTHDDSKMLDTFSKILKNAKVGISQNGKEFDHKVLRWRLNVLKLTPLKDVEILDTLQLSRQSFAAPSHKLDYRSKVYSLGGKISMGMQDWINVLNNKPGALEKMIRYGCKDVKDLRSIFWRELPYYRTLPVSLSVLVNPETNKSREFCPRCASAKQRKFDVYPTKVANKLMYECGNCGNLWKETRNINGSQVRSVDRK